MTEAIEKRVYIGGLHSSVTDQLLRDRFSRYGTISTAAVAKDDQGNCRGFGHLTITTTPKQWASCISVYNGAKWKGVAMRLEDAKPDYTERKRKELDELQRKEQRQQKKRLRLEKRFAAKELVNDKNMENRRGWRRGRYGRAIAIMRLRRPDGTHIVFDPSHYTNNLTKLYNIDARMKPVARLPIQYEDYTDDDDSRYYDTTLVSDEEKSKEEQPKSKGEEKRLAAMERRMAAEQQKHELISQALNTDDMERTNHITFDHDHNGKEPDKYNDEMPQTQTKERSAPRDSSWLFDSDEEDDDMQIKVNPVLEGEKGRERLALQSTFKGDERFRLGEDFIDADETKEMHSEKEDEEDDEISRNLNAEKDQSMDVLRAMFGEETVNKTKKKSDQWTSGARYDPEAEDADQYLRKAEESDEDVSGSEEEDTALPSSTAPVTAMPVVSTDKHFEVNVNMKPLFAAEDGPFKLFGGDDEQEDAGDAAQQPLFGGMLESDDDSEIATPKSKKHAQIGLGMMFFFHTDEPSLMAKSCFDYDPKGIFQRSEHEDFESIWQEKRSQIAGYLKKRQRRALKRKKKQHVDNRQ